jgi:hypothetical protein
MQRAEKNEVFDGKAAAALLLWKNGAVARKEKRSLGSFAARW